MRVYAGAASGEKALAELRAYGVSRLISPYMYVGCERVAGAQAQAFPSDFLSVGQAWRRKRSMNPWAGCGGLS